MSTPTPYKRNGDNPSERNNTDTIHTCVIIATYLRGGLSACSILQLLVSYFFLKVIKFLMQLSKNSF